MVEDVRRVDYARLITMKGKIVNITRMRLYDGHEHHWGHQLRNGDRIFVPTDQTHHYKSNHDYRISSYDKVWFDGVLIYKKPTWLRVWHLLVAPY